MNVASNHYPNHDFPQRWSAQDLADAVPLRLFEVLDFASGREAANNAATPPTPRSWRRGYLHSAELPAFVRVR